MKCPKCGFENLEEANFCIKCGSRIDGKIPCPKCGEYISNDVNHCPKCGKAIPHKSEATIAKDEQSKSIKARVSHIFNHVSCFVTLFLFIFVISITLSSEFRYFNGSEYYYDPYNFIVNRFSNYGMQSGVSQAMAILQLIIIVLDMLVSIAFSVFGIIKTARAFKDYELVSKSYKYLGVILAAKLLTEVLLSSSMGPSMGISRGDGSGFMMFALILHLSILIGFDCYKHFKRGQISIFVSRIILGIGMYIPLIMMSSFNSDNAYMSLNGSTYVGFLYRYGEMINALINGTYVDGFISTFIFSSINLLFIFAYISVLFYFIVYYVTSYFKGLNKFKKFRIVFYMSTIVLAIISTMMLTSSIIEHSLYASYLGNNPSYWGVYIGIFILNVLLIGVSVATFNIYNRASRRAQLEEKTTTK